MATPVKSLSQDPKRSWGSVTSIEDLLRILEDNQPKAGNFLAFRGQADADWFNQPSVLRRPEIKRKNEHRLVREIIGLHPDEFQNDHTMFDRLVRMQHFGLPTRLSDVTANPLVALYFACEPYAALVRYRPRIGTAPEGVFRQTPKDGKILIHGVHDDHVKFYDSHTVSILSNLAALGWERKVALAESSDSEDSKTALRELFRLISQENPAFQDEIVPSDVFKRVYVVPKHGNRRIVAQAGAFVIVGLQDPEKKVRGNIEIHHLTVPHEAKGPILKKLDQLGINGRTMFPELDKAARYLAEKYSKM